MINSSDHTLPDSEQDENPLAINDVAESVGDTYLSEQHAEPVSEIDSLVSEYDEVTAIEDDCSSSENDTKLANVIDSQVSEYDEEPVDENVIDSIEHRVKLVADTMFIFDERAWFLAAMFNSDFYRINYNLNEVPVEALFEHFLTEGMTKNYSPSPAFDPVYTASILPAPETDDEVDKPVFYRWLKGHFKSITPHAMFDADFYLDRYSDLAESVSNPYAHFATTGLYEDRIPCKFLQLHVNSVFTTFEETPSNIEAIFSSIPIGCSERFCRQETQVIFKKIFMHELYKQQLDADIEVSPASLYSHFLTQGSLNRHRPTMLFNDAWYRDQLSNYTSNDKDTDTLREFKSLSADRIRELQVMGTSSSFLHWFFNGIQLDIVPTPLFDTDYYTKSHPDIRNNWKAHPFMHFIETGHKEPFRRYSELFDNNFYKRNIGKLHFNSALLDFTLHGQFEGVSPAAGLQLEHFPAKDPINCSSVEEAAIYFKRRTRKLSSGPVANMIKKATALEPQLVRPYGMRAVRMAPLFHPETELMHDMSEIVPKLNKTQYDTIILMPHCRLAGSANVAGQFTKTVAQLSDSENILVITTDLSAFERPDWFPESIDVFDLSEHTAEVPQERKVRILLDVVRGLRPNNIVNINSNLGWHLTNTFGKQLSAWMNIYFYLFCWDRDQKGNKGGYPIQWFLPSFDYATAVFTDNTTLRTELQNRYCLTDAMRKKIVTLHTPAAQTQLNYQNALAERSTNKGVRRIFWSGRFDRQKRVDVLFAVAKRLPDIEFWVWGKSVLYDSEIKMSSAPENVRLMGTYLSLDDLPIASCDCFLYTSGWDGLPIILIDVASRGIPIVASSVGGVGDLVNDATGWPVVEYANPDAYCDAIDTLLADYPEALSKAQAGREHTLALCNEELYEQTLKDTMQL